MFAGSSQSLGPHLPPLGLPSSKGWSTIAPSLLHVHTSCPSKSTFFTLEALPLTQGNDLGRCVNVP